MNLSIVTPCCNEEGNIRDLYAVVKKYVAATPGVDAYEHVFIDNASTDQTVALLKEIAATDKNVKIIVNTRNFGYVRSSYHGLLQAGGDAVILMVADFQDPPELIPQLVDRWRAGHKMVLCVKERADENAFMFAVRKLYYELITKLSEINLTRNYAGFGLYDRAVLTALRTIDDPYPYFRGLVSEIGFASAKINYRQPRRTRGQTKFNFYRLYDFAMLGITSYSKVPLRLAAMLGFALAVGCLLAALGYLVAKLVFWNSFQLGLAPVFIGVFLFLSVQLFFIGILGEYIGSIYTQVLKRPLVVEQERVNF